MATRTLANEICRHGNTFGKTEWRVVLSCQTLGRAEVEFEGKATALPLRARLIAALEQSGFDRKVGVMPKTGLETLVQQSLEEQEI